MDSSGPLAGIRVLDASRVLAGPFCGQLLGDLGCEVVKVERPGQGDETRDWGPPFHGSLSAYFLSCNRNKKSITLDLAQVTGRQVFYELVKKSDVLLENFRPASAAKLGLSPEHLHSSNPHLILCSISGFGRTGPMKDLPGYDFAIQALSGLMSITGPVEGPPCKVGVAVTDVLTGLYAAVAILACLHERRKTKHGYHIDLALLDCALAAQVNMAQAYLTSGLVPQRQGNAHLQIVPYQLFATADSWLVLAVGNDGQWQSFCRACGRQDLASDQRFKTNSLRVQNRQELVPQLEQEMRRRTTAEWQKLLQPAGVPIAPVWNYADLFAQTHIAERGMRLTVRDSQGNKVDLVGSPFHIHGTSLPQPVCPPELGSQTDEILKSWLAYDGRRIDELRRQGIV
ncbi:MAG: CoA transferase [Gemmatales bacterium]|nr:MAG: CoA transferase [Gemmatales bacterium]